MPGLNTGTFALADLPRAPQFPTNLGQLQAIDPDKVYADVGKGLAQANAIATDQQQQAANLAQLGEQQGTANANRQTLAGMVAAKQAQNAQAAQAATLAQGTQPLASAATGTGLTGQIAATQRENTLLQKGTQALPAYQQQLTAIAQLPDPNAQFKAYSDLQAQNADWLGHPSFAPVAQLSNERATQALGRVAATASQQAAVNLANIRAAAMTGAADIRAGGTVGAAQVRSGAARNALDRAHDNFQMAQDELETSRDANNPNGTPEAQQAFQDASDYYQKLMNNSTAIANRGAKKPGTAANPFAAALQGAGVGTPGAAPTAPAGGTPPAASPTPQTNPADTAAIRAAIENPQTIDNAFAPGP